MAITDAQYKFYDLIKNCHKVDSDFKVLTLICQTINAEVIRDEIVYIYQIWKEGHLLFRGCYYSLIDNLFEYIFDEDINWSV